MDARPVAIVANVNPSESIRAKTQTHLTRLESHSYNTAEYKSFRITFLRKNPRGRVPLATSPILGYTHSLSLQPRSYKC